MSAAETASGLLAAIVGSQTSQKLKYAATQVPNVRLLDYELQVKLSAPGPLGA